VGAFLTRFHVGEHERLIASQDAKQIFRC
jgi:hypothetical protein